MQENHTRTAEHLGFWTGFSLASLIGMGACMATYSIARISNPVPEHMRVAEYATIVIGHDPKLAEGWGDQEKGEEIGASVTSGHYIPGGPLGTTVANYASKERTLRQIRRVERLLQLLDSDKPGGEDWFDKTPVKW